MPVNDLLKILGRNNTRLPPFYFPVSEENQCRHSPDVIGVCCMGALVYINLNDFYLVANPGFEFLQNRFHHFARTTPFGRKIYQRWNIAFYYF
jgi:hypothetical protein